MAVRREGGDRRPAGALEAEVMGALDQGEAPLTVAEVHAALSAEVSYKTVLTVLARLHAKGTVERERAGRAHAYRPRRGAARAAADQMHTALARGADRRAVLRHVVDTLEASDEAALRALLSTED